MRCAWALNRSSRKTKASFATKAPQFLGRGVQFLRTAAVLLRPSSEASIKPVTQKIVGSHRRDSPRSGPRERNPWELIDVEGARPVLATQDFQCGLVPEISHHRYAAAVAADRIVHTLVHTHMRNMIVGHAEVAAPAMGYAKGGELGPDFAHLPE